MTEPEDLNATLRQALQDEARMVEPSGEGLAAIRSRTARELPWYRRSWVAGAGAAGLATAATVVAVTVLTDTGGPNAAQPAGQGSPTNTSQPTTAGPTTAAPPASATVPVYYVGDSTMGPRLFREFHQVPAPDGAAVAAVTEMLQGRPDDPDYAHVQWGGAVRSVHHADGVITVDFAGLPDPYPTALLVPDSPPARLAVQQLVYTVQAAEQSTDPVLITVNGRPLDSISGVDTTQPIPRADPLDVQAMVWITSPSQGATVSSPVRVEGVANVFEANVSWQVLQDGTVVKEGFSTAAAGMEFSPYEATIPLPPGSYVLRFFAASMEDGKPMFVDTKDITVR